jgi:rhodanese-related sulfurtransferase
MNPYGVPGYSASEVARKLAAVERFLLLDVREPYELALANLGDGVLHAPLSELAVDRELALPDDVRRDTNQEIVVICHHGNRSAQVTAWLRHLGYSNVYNLDGGIDAYAREVDPSIGMY